MISPSLHIRYLFSSLLLVLSLFAFAQDRPEVKVTASIDTNAILIGEHVSLVLKAEYRTDQGSIQITFPKLADTIIKQIEIINASKIERIIPDSNNINEMIQFQSWIITSFDSGYYAIPPLKVIINGDSTNPIETEPLLLAVNTVSVDTTKNIKDIKPPLEVPFDWKEYLPYIYGGLAGLALLAVIIWLLIRYLKNRKKKPIVQEIIIPKIPAHVTALEQLEKLKEEKLWQQGKLKEYHSALSDILRQYIEHRFYIHTMEQVTDEILYSFRTAPASEESKIKLRQVLILADLVKFAKEHPLPHENESSWVQAYEFVMNTKPDDVKPEENKPTPTA